VAGFLLQWKVLLILLERKAKKLLGMENEWEWPKIVLEFEGEYK
jgi:hypothetical protein